MKARPSHRWMVAISLAGLAAAAFAGGRYWSRGPESAWRTPDVKLRAPADRPEPSRPPEPAQSPCPIQFREVTAETGIDFQHTDGSSGRHYIVEAMSAGVGALDYDGDGWIDLYFPNGAPLPGYVSDRPPRHALYRNLAGWRFKETTDEAGLVCHAYGLGIAVGDYDNDGHPDVYLNNFGPNLLFHNQGDGTFRDVTQRAGVARGNLVGAGACFLDIDKDGELDLYVGNYIELDLRRHRLHFVRDIPSYPSPVEYQPVPDSLFRNRGDGTFADVGKESGIAAHAGRSMGMIAADHDNDGDTDVFICNDVQENFLFSNEGGKFQEVAVSSGVAFNREGETMANMAPDAADFDRDGRLDFYTTNYQRQLPALFRNLGQGLFEDVSAAANAGAGCFHHVNWGCGFADFDNDGRPDLFIANGHTEDNAERMDRSAMYRAPNVVLWNAGQGKFVEVSAECGDGLKPRHVSRGIALEDFDNDGDIDVAVLNSRDRPTILRNMLNESGSANHWLQIQLRGVKTNRDGVGARVRVTAGDLVQIDEVHSGRSYQSHFGSRLHFGLGKHDRVDRVEVRWIGGGTDVLESLPADQRLVIVESSAAEAGPTR